MAKLLVEIDENELEALRRYAVEHAVPVDALIDGYVAYLLAGGEPIAETRNEMTDLSYVLDQGGAFDWLIDEPDLYSDADGEPV